MNDHPAAEQAVRTGHAPRRPHWTGNPFRTATDGPGNPGHEDTGHGDPGHEFTGHGDTGHEDAGHEDTVPVGPGWLPDVPQPRTPPAVPTTAAEPVPGAVTPRRPWWRSPAVVVPAAAAAVLAGGYGIDLLTAGSTIPRHTVVDGVRLGGLTPAAAAQALQRDLAPRLEGPRTVHAGDVATTLSPAAAGLHLDVAATVAAAARQPHAPWTRLTSLLADRPVAPAIARDDTALTAAIDALAARIDRAAVEATIHLDGTTPSVVPAADGRGLDRTAARTALLAAASRPGAAVDLPVAVRRPHVTAAEAERVLAATVRPALAAPVTVLSQDGKRRADVPVPALAAALTFRPRESGTLDVALDPAALQAALGTGFAGFGSPARDATFRVSGESIAVMPSADGTGLDPATLAEQLLPVLAMPAPRTVTAQLGPIHAAFTTEQAQALGVREKISSFTTRFTNTASGTNIRVVAAKVDGALVKPGETFSLNGFTGPRGTAQGYVPATVIEGGKFVPAVGGGISQFATTMYNAVFFAGLQDVHHQPHSYWISRYPAGREATVFDGLIDLAWKNDTDTGVYVQTQWTPGSITVTFWGTRHYDVRSVSGDRRDVVEPAVQTVVDDGSCKAQAGQEGFDIPVTRVFADPHTGAELRRQDFHTHYNAEPVIHCVAPGTGSPTPNPTPDATTPATDPIPSARRPARRRRP